MISSTLSRYRKIILPVIILAAIAGWFWPKNVSPAALSYYSSLLCMIAGNPQQTPETEFSSVMEKTVTSSNSDYALRKWHFDAAAANAAIKRWQKLSPAQQQQARQDNSLCARLLRDAS